MITEFSDTIQRDAHKKFQAWRRSNPRGYFLTQKTEKKYNLHLVNCHHCGNTTWKSTGPNGHSLTSHLKVCSLNRKELEKWSARKGATLKSCGTCFKPVGK